VIIPRKYPSEFLEKSMFLRRWSSFIIHQIEGKSMKIKCIKHVEFETTSNLSTNGKK
jgi:hypothetical protein